MAKVRFKKGLSANLDKLRVREGQILVTMDDDKNEMFIDITDDRRVKMTDTDKVGREEFSATIDSITELIPSEATTENQLATSQEVQTAYTNATIYTDEVAREIDQDITALSAEIDSIDQVIPATADVNNKLTDKNYVDDSINSIAAYYITRNAAGDAFETFAQLDSTTVFYSGGVVRVPTRNDYCIVRADETQGNSTTRYIYNTQWEFQYVINETPLTPRQMAALNSGITATAVAKIDEIDNKVDIVPNTTNVNRVYAQKANTSIPSSVPYSSTTSGDTLMYRTTSGQSSVAAPTSNNHIANKKYVDDKVAVISNAISEVNSKFDIDVTDFDPAIPRSEIVDMIDTAVSSAYKVRGTAQNWSDLISKIEDQMGYAEQGDVWNIEEADPTLGTKAGDNVVFTGTKTSDYTDTRLWDVLSGTIDLTNYYTKQQVYNKTETDSKIAAITNKQIFVAEYGITSSFPSDKILFCHYNNGEGLDVILPLAYKEYQEDEYTSNTHYEFFGVYQDKHIKITYNTIDSLWNYTIYNVEDDRIFIATYDPEILMPNTSYIEINQAVNNSKTIFCNYLIYDESVNKIVTITLPLTDVLIGENNAKTYIFSGPYFKQGSDTSIIKLKVSAAAGSGTNWAVEITDLATKGYAEGLFGTKYITSGLKEGYSVPNNTCTVEGYNNIISGNHSSMHVEGLSNNVSGGNGAHAEGINTIAQGVGTHAEGQQSQATGIVSHAEGNSCQAKGSYSHAEGSGTMATGYISHAEGQNTIASGQQSHAGGLQTRADQNNQTAIGKYNTTNNTGNLFVVGNGNADNDRSNAFEVSDSGKAKAGASTVAADSNTTLTTKDYVDTQLSTKQNTLVSGTNIKTVNGNSILGSGDLETSYTFSFSESDFPTDGQGNLLPLEINESVYMYIINKFNSNIPVYFNYHSGSSMSVLKASYASLDGTVFIAIGNYQTLITSLLYNNQESGKYFISPPATFGLQAKLYSGTNIKTINNTSLLGSGNIDTTPDLSNYYTKTETNTAISTKVDEKLLDLSQAAYDALTTKDPNVFYFIY